MKAGKQHEPERQLAIGRVARFLARADARFRRPKAVLWKEAVSRVIACAARTGLRSLLLVPVGGRNQHLSAVADGLAPADAGALTVAQAVTRFVHDQTEYVHVRGWRSPSKVLALGVGDCKNEARLVYELLRLRGIESEIVVGLTNRQDDEASVHAWVNVESGGTRWFCDPTVSDQPMSEEEFSAKSGRYLDISPEYLLKEPGVAGLGIGTLTHRI